MMSHPHPPSDQHLRSQTIISPADPTQTTLVGYEALAAKLSSSSVTPDEPDDNPPLRPLYRKFEHLNHRVLLYLQDEITELESELRRYDEAIAQASAKALGQAGGKDTKQLPVSRRAEAKVGTEAHHRRVELLGRIYMKTGQYSESPPLPFLPSSLPNPP